MLRSRIRDDVCGQGGLFELVAVAMLIIGVIMILVGIGIVNGGGLGLGLMVIGGGMVIGDIGGVIIVENSYVLIGGAAGAVFLLIGAFIRYGLGK